METRHKAIFTLRRDKFTGQLELDMWVAGEWPCSPGDKVEVIKAYKALLGEERYKESSLHLLLTAAQGMTLRARFAPDMLGPYHVERADEPFSREEVESYVNSLSHAEFMMFHKTAAMRV